ncbi:alpha beta-hydrolase [Micractinium conductrix]|uniref:Alpha beta-hydrolase n=1 Tax=Micractinium conductrix TaxID=554055 RepID=A0A2P6V534_9CHLO|nr:alpha beta-hydrolase [Micractinium conductrix]|eukprot:PSC69206.1 alpha beta-hydrolase [Micractinium conductrix]
MFILWRRIDHRNWRGVPEVQPKKVPLILPRSVKIPVVVLEPDRSFAVGYHLQHSGHSGTNEQPFSVVVLADTDTCGPLWRAHSLALSESSATPRGERALGVLAAAGLHSSSPSATQTLVAKAGDNHVRPVMAAAPRPPVESLVDNNAYAGSNAAHAETARWSRESADFWLSDDEPLGALPPMRQDDAGYMNVWAHKSGVVDAETSRNSLDSEDTYLELRIEFFTNREAKVLSWAVFACTLLILASSIALVVLKFTADERKVLFSNSTWYVANVSVGAAIAACLLALAVCFAYNLRSTRVARRQWSNRRMALCRDTGLMLMLQLTCSLTYLTPYALNIAIPCFWFSNAIAWLAFVRWSCYNLYFMWVVMMAHACCRYRGPDPNPDPDEQLVMDCTPRQKLRLHAPKLLLLWAPFQALICADLYERINNDRDDAADQLACAGASDLCEQEDYVEVFNELEVVVVTLFAVAYTFYLLRAFRDHRQLPFARYRLSNLFIRLSARHGVATFLAVVLTVIVLPAGLYGSLGVAPVQLAMALMMAVSAVALMPKHMATHAMLTTWQQQFAWTEEEVPAVLEALEQQLQAAHKSPHVLSLLSGGVQAVTQATQAVTEEAEAAGQQPRAGAARQLAEPVFCLEAAVKLFVWSKLAYRYWAGAAGGMSREGAMRLLGLTQGFKALRDPHTDTRLILGWSDGTLALGYRGTASRTNAVTDLKFLRTPHQPRAFHAGHLALVHSGFWRAYTANGNRDTLRGEVQDIVGGFSGASQPRILVTGHSLGGALAMLAAYDIAEAFPEAEVTVVTFGAPRVGNRAFAALHRARVPHAFQLVNDQDPVPRVPTTGFKHAGLPVLINCRGDVMVRPSYFERAVIRRTGGAVSDHKIRAYALSIAAVVKAQFSSSKWLPGGAMGAAALARAVDLGAALALTHLDLPSLQDPTLLPRSCDVGQSQPTKARKPRAPLFSCFGEGASDEAVAEVEEEEEGAEEKQGGTAARAAAVGRRGRTQSRVGLREEVVPEGPPSCTEQQQQQQQQQGGEQAAAAQAAHAGLAVEGSAASQAAGTASPPRWPWRRRQGQGTPDTGGGAGLSAEPERASLQQAEEGRASVQQAEEGGSGCPAAPHHAD